MTLSRYFSSPFLVYCLAALSTVPAFSKPNETITRVPGVFVGQTTDSKAMTGTTVLHFGKEGAFAAVDIRGFAPATRETALLAPEKTVQKIHGLFLTGGSAYGLAVGDGIMRCLEEKRIGYPIRDLVIPIVPGAALFDLTLGTPKRPDASFGYEACKRASKDAVRLGNFGAGTGATVGKMLGFERSMKSGMGSAVIEISKGIYVGALFAVNALGNVVDPKNRQIIAGVRSSQKGHFFSYEYTLKYKEALANLTFQNTTIGVVVTNASLTKVQLKIVAQMAHDGLARTIYPVHTSLDGDAIFAISTSKTSLQNEVDANAIGIYAAKVVEQAILSGVRSAESIKGYPAARDYQKK